MAGQWLLRLLQRYQPREGWLIILTALGALLILPAAVGATPWVPGLGWLLGRVVLIAFLGAFSLTRLALAWAGRVQQGGSAGRSTWEIPGWLAGCLLAGAGLLAVTLLAGWQEAPALPADTAWYAAPWVKAWQAWQEMGARVAQWVTGALGEGAAQDNAVFGWLAGLVAWGVATWAVWWLFIRRRVFVALLPAGVLLATHLFFTLQGRWWLAVFLATMALLMVLLQYVDRERAWQRAGMDYSTTIRSDTLLTGLFIAMAVFALMLPMPRLVFRPTAQWFADLAAEPSQALADMGKQFFPGLRRAPRSLVATGGNPGSLPRSFLLGSSPDLAQQPVLRVQTSDLDAWTPGMPPPAPFYWRALTYDTYTGRGWRNGPVVAADFGAGEPWTNQAWPLRRPLRQTVEVLRSGDAAFYAAGEPLAPNRRYQALLRSGQDAPADDLVAIIGSGRRYTALSLAPAADDDALRSAGEVYPPGIQERYLVLPDVPQRIVDLARRITRNADNPYDQALALQRFLRTLPYDLDVSAPPASRDVVDYFLFDAQRGYCDYYASAMVIMARSLGIPARLAVGYATGDLDVATRTYVVAEDSAHSWPELYFPGAGWIPFEPTASLPPLERRSAPAGDIDQSIAQAEVAAGLQTMQEDEIVRQRLSWLLGAALVAILAVVAWLVWRRRPEPSLVALYGKLGRWGRRLGRGPGPGESAAEFGREFSGQLQRENDDHSRLAAQGVQQFVTTFEAATYGPQRDEPARAARQTWHWLRAVLRRQWLIGRRRGKG
jgi:transglutaminase-like putative cysteine protease